LTKARISSRIYDYHVLVTASLNDPPPLLVAIHTSATRIEPLDSVFEHDVAPVANLEAFQLFEQRTVVSLGFSSIEKL